MWHSIPMPETSSTPSGVFALDEPLQHRALEVCLEGVLHLARHRRLDRVDLDETSLTLERDRGRVGCACASLESRGVGLASLVPLRLIAVPETEQLGVGDEVSEGDRLGAGGRGWRSIVT